MKTIFSTTEVAELLSVNESTVKRWSDSGHIECTKTRGGHRRFPIPSIMRFIQENKMELPEIASRLFDKREIHAQLLVGNSHPIISEIKKAGLEGDVETVLSLLRISFAANPDLLEVYSEILFPPLVEIGEDWASGAISVDMEHLASNTIREAVLRLQSDIHYKDHNGLTAICSSFEGEQHDMALYCVSSYLTAEGWHVYHLGADTPTGDLIRAINRRRPNLVVVHATIIEDEWKFLSHVSENILPAVHRIGGKLVLGGNNLEERFGKKLKADAIATSILEFRAIGNPSEFRKGGSFS